MVEEQEDLHDRIVASGDSQGFIMILFAYVSDFL